MEREVKLIKIMRSPRLDDPEFTRRIRVPGLSSMKISARDIMVGDYSNEYFNSLMGVLQFAEGSGAPFADMVAQFGLGRTPYRRFAELYPAETYLHLASLQDPEDIAELDAVALGLNELFAERKMTNTAVKELLGRAKVVFDKYQY